MLEGVTPKIKRSKSLKKHHGYFLLIIYNRMILLETLHNLLETLTNIEENYDNFLKENPQHLDTNWHEWKH